MMRSSLALVAALAAFPVHAQVYKCIEGGRTVYSQTPCPAGAESTTIRRSGPNTPPPGASGAAPQGTAEQEQSFRKRQKDQQDAAKKDGQKQAEAQEKQANCESARSQLTLYENGGRIMQYNASGERVYLDDAGIEQQKAKARASVDQWCR